MSRSIFWNIDFNGGGVVFVFFCGGCYGNLIYFGTLLWKRDIYLKVAMETVLS